MSAPGRRIAILGAESTGKSTLAAALAPALGCATGLTATWVPEVLREWVDAHGRTPLEHEQAGIAAEQQRRIDAAAASHAIVVADTTPLMVALYSRHYFGDDTLLPSALADLRTFDTTLVTLPDLPWQPDGLQREGPEVRERVHRELLTLLDAHAIAWTAVAGTEQDRLRRARAAALPMLRPAGP